MESKSKCFQMFFILGYGHKGDSMQIQKTGAATVDPSLGRPHDFRQNRWDFPPIHACFPLMAQSHPVFQCPWSKTYSNCGRFLVTGGTSTRNNAIIVTAILIWGPPESQSISTTTDEAWCKRAARWCSCTMTSSPSSANNKKLLVGSLKHLL